MRSRVTPFVATVFVEPSAKEDLGRSRPWRALNLGASPPAPRIPATPTSLVARDRGLAVLTPSLNRFLERFRAKNDHRDGEGGPRLMSVPYGGGLLRNGVMRRAQLNQLHEHSEVGSTRSPLHANAFVLTHPLEAPSQTSSGGFEEYLLNALYDPYAPPKVP